MKSFRLYRPPLPMPAQPAADLSPEEWTRLQQAFLPLAVRYRRWHRMSSYALFGFLGSVAAFMFFGGGLHVPSPEWFLLPALICWMVLLGLLLSAPSLVCPGCGNDMEYGFGRYCPECGAEGLHRARGLRNTKCAACGKTLRFHKGRRYKIRTCTHCGLALDEEGL